ncbi:type II secretion system F family protein [Kitasatospora sp. NPDC096147]|uniref:type II secretion system F family protein n=1 Tax=Kitasatospora sp. NPDC096147 TaxID=3364093 RepID=UPI0037F71839
MLLFVLCGLLVVGGLVLLVTGLRGTETDPDAPPVPRGPRLSSRAARQLPFQLLVFAVGTVLVLMFGRPPVLIMMVALVAFGLPWLYGATKADMHRIEKLEALAEWTQRLGDVLLLGVGLNQAIVTSRRTAPPALEEEIGELSARLQSRWRPEEALRAFADRLADSTADKVLAALVLRAGDSGPGLARTLGDLAGSVREEVRQRRAIEADRAKHRTTIRWLLLIILGVLVIGIMNDRYVAPYSTLVGQMVLGVVLLLFVAVIAWMKKLATATPLPRLLEPDRRSKTGPVPGWATAAADESEPATTATGAQAHATRSTPAVVPSLFRKEGP